MDCFNAKLKLDPFQKGSTYINDFKRYCDTKREIHDLKKIPIAEFHKPPPEKEFYDHETFAKWKPGIHIPFDLHTKPVSQMSKREMDSYLEEARLKSIQTRPRIYMTPAVSIDDVPDPEMRKLLCNYMYTTEWRKAEKEAAAGFKRIVPAVSKTDQVGAVNVPWYVYKPLEERFVRGSKLWDDLQKRGSTNPTRDFWVHKDPPVVCGACVNPLKGIVAEETKNAIKEAIQEEHLRLAHDKTPASYAGFKPRLPKGVPISKKDVPATHPFITTSQAITSRYAEDSKRAKQQKME